MYEIVKDKSKIHESVKIGDFVKIEELKIMFS